MPRRQKLIWFALGALSSGMVGLVATTMLQEDVVFDHSTTSYLVLEEPVSELAAGDGFDPAVVAYQSGEILRQCGAWRFETTPLYPDHLPTAELPFDAQNIEILPCAIQKAERAGIRVWTETRWGDPPK